MEYNNKVALDLPLIIDLTSLRLLYRDFPGQTAGEN